APQRTGAAGPRDPWDRPQPQMAAPPWSQTASAPMPRPKKKSIWPLLLIIGIPLLLLLFVGGAAGAWFLLSSSSEDALAGGNVEGSGAEETAAERPPATIEDYETLIADTKATATELAAAINAIRPTINNRNNLGNEGQIWQSNEGRFRPLIERCAELEKRMRQLGSPDKAMAQELAAKHREELDRLIGQARPSGMMTGGSEVAFGVYEARGNLLVVNILLWESLTPPEPPPVADNPPAEAESPNAPADTPGVQRRPIDSPPTAQETADVRFWREHFLKTALSEYGEERTVTVIVLGVGISGAFEMQSRLGELPGVDAQHLHSRGRIAAYYLAPVTDVEAFAKTINLGTVETVDVQNREITLVID
ncbi:MAG: hypothetical protein ACREJB_08650, partial [Planctomycetaceae bacterium]